MDKLSEPRRPGLSSQDVGRVHLLFSLAVYFPANTRLAACSLPRRLAPALHRSRAVLQKQTQILKVAVGASESGPCWLGISEPRNNLVFRKRGKKNNFKFQAPRASYRWPLSGEGKLNCELARWRLWEKGRILRLGAAA